MPFADDYDDYEDCPDCGYSPCLCDEEREVDDLDRCPDCGAVDRWGCDGIWSGADEILISAAYAKRCVLARRRAEERRAALAACAPRLRRAIVAARQRRDRCGSDCLRRGPGRFSHYGCPIPF